MVRYIFILFLLVSVSAKAQLVSAIIGDTDFVRTISIVGAGPYDCNTTPIGGVNWYGPYDFKDTNKFKWISSDKEHPGWTADIYFRPRTTDTVRECQEFEVYHTGNTRGCPSSTGRFGICIIGYGISSDSLVLIRPKQENILLLPSLATKKYETKVLLTISNNTNSIVSVKDITLSKDTISKITLDSVQDSLGQTIASIPPFVSKMKIWVFFSSTKGPVLQDENYHPLLQFHLSRLGRDSIYKNNPSITFPHVTAVVANKALVSFHTGLGSRIFDTLKLRYYSIAHDLQFDSLPYPFKLISTTQSDSDYMLVLACGPSVDGTFTATLKIRFTYDGFDGSPLPGTLLIPIDATIDNNRATPDSLSFHITNLTSETKSFMFPIPDIIDPNLVKSTITSYPFPFRIKGSSSSIGSTSVVIECAGISGHYHGISKISFSIPYYNESPRSYSFSVPLAATIDSVVDSTLSIDKPTGNNPLLSPNPATTQLRISVPPSLSLQYQYEIFDVTGRRVLASHVTDKMATVSISDFIPGIYTFHLFDSDHSILERFIICR